jgi:transposase
MGVSRFPEEFKAEAVRLARTSGRQKKEIADSIGITTATLYAWLKADDEARRERTAEADRLTDDERVELKRLRKENASLREDREILRKAAAYFARETK